MKKTKLLSIGMMLILSVIFTSCEAITGIFKAGMGVGIFIAVSIIAIIIGVFVRTRKGQS